jgi:hypothetical protein
MDIKQAFFDMVSPEPNSGCWLWTGPVTGGGYGRAPSRIRPGIKTSTAHRLSYELHVGPINGYVVRHKCDNPACVNPAHLTLGTHADNARDAIERKRRQPARPKAPSWREGLDAHQRWLKELAVWEEARLRKRRRQIPL